MISSLILVLVIMISIAYLTLLERKILAASQNRVGPEIVGFRGLLQPLADGVKLFMKEPVKPYKSNSVLLQLSPIIFFTLSMSL
jgi:NADH:ubiquinone oxidoreductase subunit H